MWRRRQEKRGRDERKLSARGNCRSGGSNSADASLERSRIGWGRNSGPHPCGTGEPRRLPWTVGRRYKKAPQRRKW
jgi:hypothetical protein